MGNRGSKSILSLSKIKEIIVKEQRVDGSYFGSILYPELRCTLKGCESNYQISNPSKQFIMQIRSFYTQYPSLLLRNKKEGWDKINHLPFSMLNECVAEGETQSIAGTAGSVEGKAYSPFPPQGSIIKPSLKLDPNFITGFTDAEGSFGLYIYKNTALKIG